MAGFLGRLFGWWDGQSPGTRLWTARFGREVGRDEAGNVFYSNADGTRRWVHYAGDNDASRIGPDWFGWLHHTYVHPPSVEPLARKAWEQPHLPNLTGGDGAFYRKGSIRRADVQPASDYEAWRPE